jgi:hypothetical protein
VSERPCPNCDNGTDWSRAYEAEHHPDCDGSCETCPVQRGPEPCATCRGTGLVPGPLAAVTIPGRPPNLSNQRGHWSRRHRMATARLAVVIPLAKVARNAAGLPVAAATEPRKLRATVFYRVPRPDRPNVMANLKHDVDGLVRAGWLPDDNARWLPEPPELVVADAERGQERVEWEMWPA